MTDFLEGYSIQHWLESCAQGYLTDTEYGHQPGEREPALVMEDPLMREQAISLTVQLIAGERCALAASSGLINAAPDEPSKRFLATQTLDEARHVEVFTQRLFDLGVKKGELDSVVADLANPNLVRFAEILPREGRQGRFRGGRGRAEHRAGRHGVQRLRDAASLHAGREPEVCACPLRNDRR